MPTLLIYGFLALAILGTLSGIAYQIHDAGYQKAVQECKDAAAAQKAAEEKQVHQAASGKEKADAKARVVYRTITKTVDKVVERPVYRNTCFDNDGLRIVNRALTGGSGEEGNPATKPDRGLPRPNQDGRSDSGSRVEKAR